jgi:hypothetical protein
MKRYVLATPEGKRASCLLNSQNQVSEAAESLKRAWPDVKWSLFTVEYTSFNSAFLIRGRVDTSQIQDCVIRENLIRELKSQPKMQLVDVV